MAQSLQTSAFSFRLDRQVDELGKTTGFLPIIRPTLVEFDEVEAPFREVWRSGQVTVGKYTRQFEEAVEQTLGVSHAIAVSSCTAGLMLAVKAMELTGEVIVPSFTFAATVHALVWNGCTPVFADCEEGTYNIDVAQIESLITKRTSAIMPVYTYGLPPRLEKIERVAIKHRLKVLSDSAQGLGAKYKGRPAGGFGFAEVFSLSPTKVVSAIEGGLVTTNHDELARRIRFMRDYGKAADGCDMEFVGLSARLSEFHAIVGLKNFQHLTELVQRRNQLITYYKQQLAALPGISFQHTPKGSQSTGNYMVIFVDPQKAGISRDGLYEALHAEGIQTKKYFYPPVHQQTAYGQYRAGYEGRLPVTERAAQRGLALPLFSHMDERTIDYICERAKEIVVGRF
jgi:dTDP-4-amino-4,6-dideoxygalactose transaminase